MATAFCPNCDELVNLGAKPVEGKTITCESCGTELEIISVNPLELDWAYLEPADDDEDWD